jgi:hypothetical protein
MKKIKSMCSIDKSFMKKNKDKYLKEVKKPKYYCADCFRVANSKNNLCEPTKIEKE